MSDDSFDVWWSDYLDIGVIDKLDLVGDSTKECPRCGCHGYVVITMFRAGIRKQSSFCSRCGNELPYQVNVSISGDSVR